MAIRDSFTGELQYEVSMTRKMLERVPMDKKDWKPHEKSMTLGRLATHIAENLHWIPVILQADEFDFAVSTPPRGYTAASTGELLSILDKNADEATRALAATEDEAFQKNWNVKMGPKLVMASPKKVAIRGWAFSHMIHHRGQLSVYLRMLDVPVPGMYGPSADEKQ